MFTSAGNACQLGVCDAVRCREDENGDSVPQDVRAHVYRHAVHAKCFLLRGRSAQNTIDRWRRAKVEGRVLGCDKSSLSLLGLCHFSPVLRANTCPLWQPSDGHVWLRLGCVPFLVGQSQKYSRRSKEAMTRQSHYGLTSSFWSYYRCVIFSGNRAQNHN